MGPTRSLKRNPRPVDISGGIQATISGRYAIALFELAREAKAIDAVESDLDRVRQGLHESDMLRRLVTSPVVGRTEAGRAIAAAADALALGEITRNLLGVLAQNRRLGELERVVRDFRMLAARHRGETTAEVVSAHPLAPAQVDALKQQLRARTGRDVTVDLSVDPALLGGLVVRIGSQMIDSSIRTRLNALAHAMKG
nr:F0F1 ATP synthase subunit delta [Sphingomonas sp. SFZ2018-12]